MNYDPLRHLTRGLSDAVPHDPRFIAMTEGNGIIPTTWGDLASRLVEAEVVDAAPAAVCDFLMIDAEQLGDPTIIFEHSGDVHGFEAALTSKYEDSYRAAHGETAKADAVKFEELREKWKIDDGKEKAAELHQEVLADGKNMEGLVDEPYWEAKTKLTLKAVKRNAFDSGYCVGLAEFVSTVLAVDELGYFKTDDVINAIDSMIENLFSSNYLDKDVPVSDVFLGAVQIRDFMQSLFWKYSGEMRREVRRHWEILTPFIYAGHISDHPLLAGNET